MKRKDIVKNKRQFARLVADLDGRYTGLNHKDIERTQTIFAGKLAPEYFGPAKCGICSEPLVAKWSKL